MTKTERLLTREATRRSACRAGVGLAFTALLASGCVEGAQDLSGLHAARHEKIPLAVEQSLGKVGLLTITEDNSFRTFDSTAEFVTLADGQTLLVGAGHGVKGSRFGLGPIDCNNSGASFILRNDWHSIDTAGTEYKASDNFYKGADLAVLKLDQPHKASAAPTIELAPQPSYGDVVYSAGYAKPNNTKTREPYISIGEYIGNYQGVMLVAQAIDNRIEPGTSGGPVMNKYGEMFGTTVGATEAALTINQINVTYGLDMRQTPADEGQQYYIQQVNPITGESLTELSKLNTCDF